MRERVHRNTAESTNNRVKWWSIFQMAVVVAEGVFQVWWLKRFFEVSWPILRPVLVHMLMVMCCRTGEAGCLVIVMSVFESLLPDRSPLGFTKTTNNTMIRRLCTWGSCYLFSFLSNAIHNPISADKSSFLTMTNNQLTNQQAN